MTSLPNVCTQCSNILSCTLGSKVLQRSTRLMKIWKSLGTKGCKPDTGSEVTSVGLGEPSVVEEVGSEGGGVGDSEDTWREQG